MASVDFPSLQAFLQTNWGWAAGLAGSMLALTLLAGGLLNQERKDEIALWLMGAQTEENWSKSFTSLFDAVFGARHLSLRCFLRSAIASLIAVALIWLLMGNLGALGLRIRSDLSLGGVLVLALAVNVAGRLPLAARNPLAARPHRPPALVARAGRRPSARPRTLRGDHLARHLAYLRSPLYAGEAESFAEILGLFSIFSVLFYSTFLTSVWTWAYILSTWLVRVFVRLRLARSSMSRSSPSASSGLHRVRSSFSAQCRRQFHSQGCRWIDRF